MLVDRLGLSQRRACRLVGQHRSTQRHQRDVHRDDELRAWLRRFSQNRPRWGHRRAHALLRAEGWHVNAKRVARLWREEGLRVPSRRRKRQRLGDSTVPAQRQTAERPNQVWALDFQFEQTADGRIRKLLNIVDEHTREALAIEVARRFDADATVATLDRITGHRGAPQFLRCDNGPELTAAALRDWCRFTGTGTSFIETGQPLAEPLRGVVQRPAPRRTARRRTVRHPARGPGHHRGLEDRLQHPPPPQQPRPAAPGRLRCPLPDQPPLNSHQGWTDNRGPVSTMSVARRGRGELVVTQTFSCCQRTFGLKEDLGTLV